MKLINNKQKENRTMSLKEQIFGLLEPDEMKDVIARQKAEQQQKRFEEQYEWFYDSVVIPVFQEIEKQFSGLGRTASIFPPFQCGRTPGLIPTLCIEVPKGRAVRYRIEIKPKGDQFLVELSLAVSDNKSKSDEYECVSRLKRTVSDLSEIGEDAISQSFIDQYDRHIKNANNQVIRT